MNFKITIKYGNETRTLIYDEAGTLQTADTMSIKIKEAPVFISLIRQSIALMQRLGWRSIEIEKETP